MRRILFILVLMLLVGTAEARYAFTPVTGTSGGLSDGVYGDVTVSGDGTIMTVDSSSFTDPNSHDAVTLDANAAAAMELTGQELEIDILTPASGSTKLSTAGQIYNFVVDLLANFLDKATYDSDNDGYADFDTSAFLTAAQTKEQVEDWMGAMLPAPDSYTDDTNNIRRYFEKIYPIGDPNAWYVASTNHRICLDPNSKYAVTITECLVTLEADPTTEIDCDFKFADAYIGVANATLVVAIDTASGVSDVDSGFNDATIPANKAWYLQFGSQPDADTEEMCLTIRGYYD